MNSILSESTRSKIYKEVDETTGEILIWKTKSQRKNSYSELENEFSITGKLKIKGIRKPVKRKIYENRTGFLYKYIEGDPLTDHIKKRSLSLKEILKISIRIVNILSEIHQSGFYHFRINSNNVIYNTGDGNVELIDFSLAGSDNFPKPMDDWDKYEEWGAELAYIAPEQTGHLKQNIDHRTDLYSFGILLYEMITGIPPFYDNDYVSLIQKHLVSIPDPVIKIATDIPKTLSQIIDKLLAKNPNDRYQSAYGVERDLIHCLDNLNNGKKEALFQIGEHDKSIVLNLPDKIYDRETDLEKLIDGFKKVKKGDRCIFIVTGDVGTGITSLIQSFKTYVNDNDGILLSTDFYEDKTHQNILIETLKELVDNCLSESYSNSNELRSILETVIVEEGLSLIEKIPEFEIILNKPVSGSSVTELNIVYRKIISSLNRPVILNFENVQWADRVFWKTVQSILLDNEMRHIMLILSYNNEKSNIDISTHSKIDHLLKSYHQNQYFLNLENISYEALRQFIIESMEIDNLEEFCKIIYSRTHGNPLYTRQLLYDLDRDKIIRFSPQEDKWLWDASRLEEIPITENVIKFLCGKINHLTEESRSILQLASCQGFSFDLEILDSVSRELDLPLGNILSKLIDENLILSTETKKYRFVHERIMQEVYDMVTPTRRTAIHYRIARAMSSNYEISDSQEVIYNIARHYNLGKKHITENERFNVIQLNLNAGKEAKKDSSFELSFSFFESGVNMLIDTDWDEHYDQVLELISEAVGTGILIGKEELTNNWINESLERAKNLNDRIRFHEIILNHLAESHKFDEAIDHLLTVYDDIGYPVKRNPGKLKIFMEFLLVNWYLLFKKIPFILNLPMMKNERARSFIKLSVNSTSSIYGYAPDILPVVIFKQVRLSLKYGNSEYSPFAYGSYGFSILVLLGNVKKSFDFGKMSLDLADKLNADSIRSKTMVTFYGFLSLWKQSMRDSIIPLRESYEYGRKTGDYQYAAFSLLFHNTYRVFCGENLIELLPDMTEDCQTIRNMNQDLVYDITENLRQFVINLTNPSEYPLDMDNEGFSERFFLNTLDKVNDQASKFDFYTYKLGLSIIFNSYDAAVRIIETINEFDKDVYSRQITYPFFLLWSSIYTVKKIAKYPRKKENRSLKRKLRRKIRLMKGFARYAPQNFSNKYFFMLAQLSEINGNPAETGDYYEKAIQSSIDFDFIHEESLYREHYANYLLTKGNLDLARDMMQKAYRCYLKWGAKAKSNQLLEHNRDLFSSIDLDSAKSGSIKFQKVFDLETIIRANQILSSQNDLNDLLEKMVEIVLKNASVTKILILLKSSEDLLEPKIIGYNDEIIFIQKDTESEVLFPESVVNYSARMNITYKSSNLSDERKFSFDEYIKRNSPVSVCCIPIIAKEKSLGIIYLENNLTINAFDDSRQEFFETISNQLAISIENASLYSEMEQKITERTNQLSEEKKKSDDLLLNILPRETAEELKKHNKTTPRKHDNVTVLICDIKDFTKIAENLTPEELVLELDHYFKNFDDICNTYNIEKIKTVGDAYIAAAGLLNDSDDSAIKIVNAAVEMIKFSENTLKERKKENKPYFQIRIGISTGTVVAGVVGTKKFQYDIWGNTVNIAARMEQNSLVGRINISKSTYEKVKEKFKCSFRGKIEVKNLGALEMYFVES